MSRPNSKNPIIGEIETALRDGSGGRRIDILMRVTDLFVTGAARFTEEETRLLDDVIGHLIERVESVVLAELSARLAPVPNAPADTVRRLAHNDAAEVAGPVLNRSARLTDDDLIAVARSKSQAHLTHIARRPQLNKAVTEVLVDNGNSEVANTVARNAGAELSRLTVAKLVMRADGDGALTESLASRPDISPAMFRRLLAQATETVRKKLLASAPPSQRSTIEQILRDLSAQIGKAPPRPPRNYTEARRTVAAFSQDTDVTRLKALEFADSKRVAETAVVLSVLSGVPVEPIDKLIDEPSGFGLMVLCRSVMLEWNTAKSILAARMDVPPLDYDDLAAQFAELSVASAQKLVHFWAGRQKVAQSFPR